MQIAFLARRTRPAISVEAGNAGALSGVVDAASRTVFNWSAELTVAAWKADRTVAIVSLFASANRSVADASCRAIRFDFRARAGT
jgi:hypothetical protein